VPGCCVADRGVHLKDLILLHTALPDWVDDIYVNFRKMVQLSMIFTELMQVQNATLPIEPNMDLVNTVRVRSSVSRLSSISAQFVCAAMKVVDECKKNLYAAEPMLLLSEEFLNINCYDVT